MSDLGEAVVVEEDLSEVFNCHLSKQKYFSNYLTFSDLSGDWEVTSDGETSIIHISADSVYIQQVK